MRNKFIYEFEDESSQNAISFDYSEDVEEEMTVRVEDGIPVIYANKKALLCLGKILIKMGTLNYSDGFHLHVSNDFDADQSEGLRIILNNQ